MCSFSGATCTSRVRHNADYVPHAKSALIYRRGLRQRVASLTLNCNGDFALRAYGSWGQEVFVSTDSSVYSQLMHV